MQQGSVSVGVITDRADEAPHEVPTTSWVGEGTTACTVSGCFVSRPSRR